MPTVTFDSRSFMLDGRRIWIVGGTISYAHTPRAEWADRLHAARLAGLNTVMVPVVWARHEPLPGQFEFSENADLRAFIELAHEAGLYVILRLGPVLGEDYDFGGLPTWLTQLPAHELRADSGAFLEACSRFIGAVADQVRDLQINAAGKGGPILLVQNEHQWTCGDSDLAPKYLGELYRYIRESGLTVPAINANNLWAGEEAEIDCWVGSEDLLASLRQLSEVKPDRPRMVLDLALGDPPVWGAKEEPVDGGALLRRIVEILAGAGQFTLGRFAPGAHLGFSGGRLANHPWAYAATDRGGLVDAAGRATPAMLVARRACTFASSFARVLAHLNPELRPMVVHPGLSGREAKGQVSVVQLNGSQGGVAFVFDPAAAGSKTRTSTTLLMADGTPIPVSLGEQGVAWLLHDIKLTSKHTLEYTNLSVLTSAGSMLVAFGPAATEGVVCINGSALSVTVPRGKSPQAIEHEGVLVIVCNEQQVDECFVHEGRAFFGVAGLNAQGQPIPLPGAKTYMTADADGTIKTEAIEPTEGSTRKTPKRLALDWSMADTDEYCTGQSAKYASIDGPADLATLGAPSGYGWYRMVGKFGGEKAKLAFPEAADRLHVFLDGEAKGLAGFGPGAADRVDAKLPKGDGSLVVLAENLGRAAAGILFGERKGVFGDAFELEPLAMEGPVVEQHAPTDLLAFRSPMWLVHQNDQTSPFRFVWNFTHRRKSPLYLSIAGGLGRGLLMLNDQPLACFDDSGFTGLRLEPEEIKRGANVLHLALHDDGMIGPATEDDAKAMLPTMAKALTIDEGVNDITGKCAWAFAKWERPAPSAYEPVAKASLKAQAGPTWWKSGFEHGKTAVPLVLDLTGLTKGQVYVNGHHLGRYFVATADKKATGNSSSMVVPASWLKVGKHNELAIFDEHGAPPGKVKMTYDASGSVLVG
ncbi:MAG: beta-galactosidase [Phycisphaerales bacterium]